MPCVVPTCGASVGTFKLFPLQTSLSERWLEAIHVGCEVKAADDDYLSPAEICHWHFAKPIDEVYQEPKIFFNCKREKVEIDSCRMCLRFYPIRDMVSEDGMLSGMDIKSIVYESLRIDFQSNDFLKLICTDCLARLELLQSIQKHFLDAENRFHDLIGIVLHNANKIGESIKLSPPVEVVMKEDRDESNSESDGGTAEEDSSDEWTPPEVPVDIRNNQAKKPKLETKCKSTNGTDSTRQPKIPLKELIARKCYICPVVLESANDLAAHLTEKHSNMKSNRCEECSRDFPMLAAYNKHLSRHDETRRPHKCSVCPIRFQVRRGMLMHENSHHGAKHDIAPYEEKITPAICETCGVSFKYKSMLTRHVRLKHNAPKDKCKCTICEKTFTTLASLERHMLLHTNEKPYVCSFCDLPFRRLFNLKNHVQKVHEGKNPHFCSECNLEFTSYEALYRHRKYVHLKMPRPNQPQENSKHLFKCKLCSEKFCKDSELQQHISTSHANESYPQQQCPFCPQTFTSYHRLFYHRRTHTTPTETTCVCQECGKAFKTAQALKSHIQCVHEQRQFNCSICPAKTYKSMNALRRHMTMHTRGKSLACEFCDKRFNQNSHLIIHRRLHTGEKPFECPKCSKRFSDDGTFSKHKKRCLATVAKMAKEEENTKPMSG